MVMKKLIAMLMTAMMIMTFSIPAAVAAETGTGTTTTGSVTINGIVLNDDGTLDNTYEIYQLLDLESYNTTTGAYSYKVNSAWDAFFATDEAKDFVTIDGAGYVTWVAGEDDDTVATFAKGALSYAKANGIAPVKSSENEGDFVVNSELKTGKFADLPLGYYLIDSSVGALCGLTTTNPDASINAKNGIPTIDKQVKEDSTGQWADENTADIGQTVEFRTTINVHAGAENYVLHDKMSAGLTFDENSVTVQHVVPPAEAKDVAASNYTVKTEGLTDGCTFEIVFNKEFCDTLETNDKLLVHYSAMLNRNAIVAGTGNSNEAKLDYGEGNSTTSDKTTTRTFGFDIVKTDSQNTLIDGAEFKVYDAATGGNEIAVVLMDDGETYRRARADETGVSIVVNKGIARVQGFDNGTYYLEETVAPAGYNKLTARQKFIISDGNLDSVFNDEIFSTGSGVHVVNKTGSMLPETGGMGTTIFMLIGGIAVLGAAVVLFARRRMSQYE